ncbi:PTTG1 protein, partial [Alectura lathami]|nr:PTTG1 protein [Alectura lathami]
MTTLIFVDQENGEVVAAKNQLRLPSGSSKALSERTQVNTPLPKKTIRTPATCRSVRKALGNVNRTAQVISKKELMRDESRLYSADEVTEKATGSETWNAAFDETYLEIENMFPADPFDGEYFDLPEEHSLSNIDLRGVPLMMFASTSDEVVDMAPSPVKLEEVSWESDFLKSTADFIATLDEIIDMPPMNYDL